MATLKIKAKTQILKRDCAVCGKKLQIILFPGRKGKRKYTGGNYFGKIPFYSRAEMKKAHKAGTHVSRIGKWKLNVMNYDPKPYKYEEYWECDTCYAQPDTVIPGL